MDATSDTLISMTSSQLQLPVDSINEVDKTVASWVNLDSDAYRDLQGPCEDIRSAASRILASINDILGDENHEEGPIQSSNEEEDEDVHETAAQKTERIVGNRFTRISLAATAASIPIQELISRMDGRITGSHQTVEDDSLVRVLRGYSSVPRAQLETVFIFYSDVPEEYDTFITTSRAADSVVDLNNRIDCRDQHLYSSSRSSHGHHFLHILLRQMEAIKFASDWSQKGRQVGGKAFKAKFISRIYETRTTRPVPMVPISSAEDIAAFKMFKKNYRNLISARNLLFELYSEFGASVLLDPVWDVNCILKTSKTFRALFQKIRTARPSFISTRNIANTVILKEVVDVMSGGALTEHVQIFLNECPGGNH